MKRIGRQDRLIAVALVVVLVALLSVVLVRHSHGSQGAAAPRQSLTTGTVGAPGTTDPPSSVAPPPSTGGAPTTSAPAPTTTAPTVPTVVAGQIPPLPATLPVPGPVTAVGDSIMIDIQPELEADIPGVQVDGEVSRQFDAGIAVVQADRAAGTLGNVLVVELGTNGSVTPSEVDEMMQAAAGVHRVVFVNVNVDRPWAAPDNQVLADATARYPGLAVLADWYTLSTGQTQWFAPDGVHLEPTGAQAMAALITGLA